MIMTDRLHFLNVHLQTSLTCHTDNRFTRLCHCDPCRRRKTEAHRRRVWICDKTLPFFNLKGLAACHPGSSHTDHEILIFLHGFGEFFIESIDICAALFLCLIMFLCYDRIFFSPEKALVSPVLSLKQRMSFICSTLLCLRKESTDQFPRISDNRKADMETWLL